MSRLRQLSAGQAARTLAARLGPTADRLRQKLTEFGLRPYNCELVWTRWGGGERGAGHQVVAARVPLLPNPQVVDLTSVSLNPMTAGVLPAGSVRLERVSPRYPQDLLSGLLVPCDPAADFASRVAGTGPIDLQGLAMRREEVPEPFEFFYEVAEDGRSNGGRGSPRARFRLLSAPFRKPGRLEWTMVLERVSEDMARDGRPED